MVPPRSRRLIGGGVVTSRDRIEMSNHITARKSTPRLRGRAERIFVSVDESTGRSTISFHPADIGDPILHDDDRTGAVAMTEAKAIADEHPGSTIHGPHFHAARPPGRKRVARRPPSSRD
jgi:hypothetical protein